MENNSPKRLYRSTKEKMIGGVCGGIGEYFNMDPTLVRLAFVLLCVLAGGGLIAYVIALIIIPEAPAAEADNTAHSAAPDSQAGTATQGDAPQTADETAPKADTSGENSPTML